MIGEARMRFVEKIISLPYDVLTCILITNQSSRWSRVWVGELRFRCGHVQLAV